MFHIRGPELLRASRLEVARNNGPTIVRIDRLSVARGELIAVLGGNGSGKSTLLATLATLNPARAGAIRYEDDLLTGTAIDLAGDPELAGRYRNGRLGYVPQATSLFDSLSVADNIGLRHSLRPGAAPNGREIDDLLGLVGLAGCGGRLARFLSGGEQQRVGIARALFGAPPLLLLDEPTAALDAEAGQRLFSLLRSFARQGAGVVVACHNFDLALRFADRVWLVHNKTVQFPFAGDPDDPSPAGDRPFLSPASVEGRSTDDALTLAQRVHQLTFARKKEKKDEKEDEKHSEEPLAPALEVSPLPPEVRPSIATSVHLGWREVTARRQLLLRGLVCLLVVMAVFAFAVLRDLGTGVVAHLSHKTPPDDEFINRIDVSPLPPLTALTTRQLERLRTVPGLRPGGVSVFQALGRVKIRDASGKDCDTAVVSAPDGDAHLAPVENPQTAGIGLIYLAGRPFRAEDNDRAGAIVTRSWLRRTYWGLSEGQADRPYPESLDFRLRALEQAHEKLSGWNGLCRVPVVGVVDHPPRVEREQGEAIDEVFLTEGFLSRLRVWQPSWAFTYLGVDGQPLAKDYEIVREVRLTIPHARSPWQDDAILRNEAAEAFYPIVPLLDGDSLVLKLSPETRVDQLATKEMVDERLSKATAEAKRFGAPKLNVVPIRCTNLAGSPGETPAPCYGRAVLRFADISRVLDGEQTARTQCPELSCYVRYQQAIENLRAIRFVVDNASRILEAAFVLAMLFVVGTLAALHAMAKTAEAAVLRVHGVPRRRLARFFLAQLGLLVFPASVLGLILARTAAWWCDDWVAGYLAPGGEKIFASMQGFDLWGVAWVLGSTLAALQLGTWLAVFIANRKPIVESLAARY